MMFPALFPGCGDGFCNPFRGERCYHSMCPECSPENINRQWGITDYYTRENDIDGDEIQYCYCPTDLSSDYCPVEVRDLFGCVEIREINEPAEAPCQCDWKGLNLTDAGYCCPSNAVVAFSKTVVLMDEGDKITVPNSNCGNLTIEFERVKLKDWVWNETFEYEKCIDTYLLGALPCAVESIAKLYSNYHKSIAANYLTKLINVPKNAEIIYEANVTYYDPNTNSFKVNKSVDEIPGKISGLVETPIGYRFLVDASLLNCTVDDVELQYDVWLADWGLKCCYKVRARPTQITCRGLEFHHKLIKMVPVAGRKVSFRTGERPKPLSLWRPVEELQTTLACWETVEGWACYFNTPPSGYAG